MKRLLYDLLIIVASIIFAIVLVKTHAVPALFSYLGEGMVLASFFAGLFFTSIFTTAPAIAVLGELALRENLLMVSFLGALGAVAGDYVLYLFVRDHVAQDAAFLLSGPRFRRMWRVLKRSHFRRVLPILGGLIIASPLPDELGLALLGVSNIKTRSFFVISFSMNFLGIIAIGLVARSIA